MQKYLIIAGPIQFADGAKQTGEIVALDDADGVQLTRWGIVKLHGLPNSTATALPVAGVPDLLPEAPAVPVKAVAAPTATATGSPSDSSEKATPLPTVDLRPTTKTKAK